MDETQNNSLYQEEEEKPSWRSVGLFVFDFLKVFLIAIAIIIPVRWFLFQPFVVSGDSMLPNFESGDYLIIDELTYRLRAPARGEVVVMRFPNDPSQFFIKRIVGLPGERVIIEQGRVTIANNDNPEGAVLDEKYLPRQGQTYGDQSVGLDGDEYFVMGDNRLSSSDSRAWGPLSRDFVIGRAVIRVFPLSDFRLFSRQSYNPAVP